MTERIFLSFTCIALISMVGCSDPTLPHREGLAICIIKSIAPLELDFDAIAPEMHRMHMGSERARRTAALLDDFLATSPSLDPEILDLVAAYANTERKLHSQFQAAIDDGRTDLAGDEIEIAKNCCLAGVTLQQELCKRIDFDSLVTTYP